MGTAIAVRTDYRSGQLRGLAARVKDVGQARRLLAIAAVLDGHSRTRPCENCSASPPLGSRRLISRPPSF
jgi:hypothetical protein